MSRTMNYHQVMNVGNDNSSRHLHTNSTNPDEKNKSDFKGKQLVIWLAGLLLSCIPLLAVPFYDLLYNNEFWGSLYNTFCGCEILFLGISLAVSALNDFLGNPSGMLHRIWTIFTILFIILGSIIYGIVVLQNRNNIEPNPNTAFIVNVVYLGIIFILGLIRYIASMFGGKMNSITSTLICVLVGIGTSSVVLGVIDLISNIKRHRSLARYNRNNKMILTDEESESHINQNLIVISDNHNPVEQAKAFISLMELKYVLVNVISNEGNKYSDDNQLKSTRESLNNKQILSNFSELEGHYE